jgi:hypothetical protein
MRRMETTTPSVPRIVRNPFVANSSIFGGLLKNLDIIVTSRPKRWF